MEGIRRYKKLGMWVVIIFFVFIVFISVMPVLLKSDLRYERNSYSVSKDQAITSCVVKNYGRRSAEKTRMSVEFLSRILDVRFSPGSAGKIIKIAPDQHNAVLELENIAPKGEMTIFFSVERPQDKPFDIHLLDISERRPLKERTVPIK